MFSLNNEFFFPLTGETMEIQALIRPSDQKEIVPLSLDVCVVVCYSNNNVVRVIRQNKTIKPSFVLIPTSVSEDKCPYKISIETNKMPPLLTNIFQGETCIFVVHFTFNRKPRKSSFYDSKIYVVFGVEKIEKFKIIKNLNYEKILCR